MGLKDILIDHDLDYDELVDILYELDEITTINANATIDNLDQLYSEIIRKDTIDWLEKNRSHGAFDGFPEETMNFNELSFDEIMYYHDEWMVLDKEEAPPTNKKRAMTVIETTQDLCDRTFYISQCPICGTYFDANQVQKYCHECGQKLKWKG